MELPSLFGLLVTAGFPHLLRVGCIVQVASSDDGKCVVTDVSSGQSVTVINIMSRAVTVVSTVCVIVNVINVTNCIIVNVINVINCVIVNVINVINCVSLVTSQFRYHVKIWRSHREQWQVVPTLVSYVTSCSY